MTTQDRLKVQTHWVFGHVGFFFAWCCQQPLTKGVIISGKTVVVKGRLKDAAAMTGNGELRAAGKTDQAIGRVKQIAKKGRQQALKKVRE
jgi:uncharacterized protein YjbJ (UPF0337 family)